MKMNALRSCVKTIVLNKGMRSVNYEGKTRKDEKKDVSQKCVITIIYNRA